MLKDFQMYLFIRRVWPVSSRTVAGKVLTRAAAKSFS